MYVMLLQSAGLTYYTIFNKKVSATSKYGQLVCSGIDNILREALLAEPTAVAYHLEKATPTYSILLVRLESD